VSRAAPTTAGLISISNPGATVTTFEHDPATTRRWPGFAAAGESDARAIPAPEGLAPHQHAAAPRVAVSRLCILCGGPRRAGQHMIRVHGSTIHAHCSATNRDRRARQ